jgi:hypothetical protein
MANSSKKKTIVTLVAIAATAWPDQYAFAEKRSYAAKAEFKRLHPCPANGQKRGPCLGYILDHIVPLCAGGPDSSSNMQWQTVSDAKAKDRDERMMCVKNSRR